MIKEARCQIKYVSDIGSPTVHLMMDECHHSTASTYRKLLEYFKPNFTLGLTATPERVDGEDLLELFRNVAHKLD